MPLLWAVKFTDAIFVGASYAFALYMSPQMQETRNISDRNQFDSGGKESAGAIRRVGEPRAEGRSAVEQVGRGRVLVVNRRRLQLAATLLYVGAVTDGSIDRDWRQKSRKLVANWFAKLCSMPEVNCFAAWSNDSQNAWKTANLAL